MLNVNMNIPGRLLALAFVDMEKLLMDKRDEANSQIHMRLTCRHDRAL